MKAKVYIDLREQDKIQNILQFWEASKKEFPHIESVEVRKNEAGDICTGDGIFGNERKSAVDFIPSICGGKLKQQLHELKQNFKYAFLFVEDYEGIMDCITKNPQVHYNVIIGAMASAMAHSQVPICFVGDFYAPVVFRTIEKLYDGKSNEYQKEYTPIRRDFTKEEEQLNILLGIKGVKRVRAIKLLNKFNNSIKTIANADIKELMEIDGIGDGLATHIKEVLA